MIPQGHNRAVFISSAVQAGYSEGNRVCRGKQNGASPPDSGVDKTPYL